MKIWLKTDQFHACGIDPKRNPSTGCATKPTLGAYTVDPAVKSVVVAPWHLYTVAGLGTYAWLRVEYRAVIAPVPAGLKANGATVGAEYVLAISLCGTSLPEAVTRDVNDASQCRWRGTTTWTATDLDLTSVSGSPTVIASGGDYLTYRPCWNPGEYPAKPPCWGDNACGDGPYRITIVAQVRLPDGRWGQDAVSFEAVPDGPPPLHLSGIPSPQP